MTKKPSLSAALNAASKKVTAIPTTVVSVAVPAAEPQPKTPSAHVRPIRVGKKAVVGYFDPAVSRQLKQMALDQDSNVQELIREALNDLFEKHRLKPIA